MNDMFGEVIFGYTSEQAVEDGILFDILQVNPEWEKGIFRYITTNLMAQGYLQDDDINVPNLLDRLNQANVIVRNASNGFKDKPESFSLPPISLHTLPIHR
ncbi:hypothetical protein HNV12_16710 [Methanococcoides sp. SA1]|nr:hypothetical protein [Methanococcoides sp. SA1]